MEYEQLVQLVRTQQNILNQLVKSDRYVFQRDLQFLAGRNFQFDTANGTKIGTGALQKIGFWDATPIVQPAHVANANNVGAAYSQSEVQDIADTLNTLISRLENAGILASS
jgi:hypothetical protein